LKLWIANLMLNSRACFGVSNGIRRLRKANAVHMACGEESAPRARGAKAPLITPSLKATLTARRASVRSMPSSSAMALRPPSLPHEDIAIPNDLGHTDQARKGRGDHWTGIPQSLPLPGGLSVVLAPLGLQEPYKSSKLDRGYCQTLRPCSTSSRCRSQ
jgi:hypothetical protein